jgi:vancomycin resistance protein YoaR
MMRSIRSIPRSKIETTTWLLRAFLGLLVAAFGLLASLATFVLCVRVFNIGRALPGITVAGVPVSGMTEPEIELALGEGLTYPSTGRIVLEDGGQQWVAAPADLGVILDAPTMAQQALAIGRRGSLGERLREQFDAWFSGWTVAPVVIFDQRAGAAYLERVAAVTDVPTVEAALYLQGMDVIASPGRVGRRLNVAATLDSLRGPVSLMHDASVFLQIDDVPPRVLDASHEAELASAVLQEPMRLTAEGADPLTITPEQLAAMLRFPLVEDQGGPHYAVELDPQALAALLGPIGPDLERRPENARFIFNDDTRQLDLYKSAVIGRTLDIPATIAAINDGLASAQHEIPMVFITTDPAVKDDATAEDLGITELVANESTYFAGSSPERIQNIKTASSAFHGLLVPPGGTLSMADVLGDISLDNGYAEALIIFGDKTINGVGGGVCQVSTTLFRAVFFGGYPIVERNPHAYRVLYYEQGPNSPGPGLDATVFVPMVDFKFTNDTPYWLSMETYVTGNRLQWKFYSTSDGRAVDWTSKTSNEVDAPDDLYRENPDLAEGEIKQVDYHADGLDVVVNRTVTRNGEVLDTDTIKTHYLPWRAIYEYGPGTELPEGAITEEDGGQ